MSDPNDEGHPESNSTPERSAVLVTMDITAVKEAQEEVRRSRLFLQTVLDAFPGNVAVLDGQGRIATVNERWTKFGKAEGLDDKYRTLGTDYLQVCRGAQGQDRQMALHAAEGIEAVLAGRQAQFDMEYPCSSPTKERWFRLRASGFTYEDKRWAVVAHVDTTKRKRAEEALRDSEERFRRIFEQGPVGIATSGADFRFLHANAAFCELMGRTESELKGLTFRDLTHPEDLGRDIEPIQRLSRGEIPVYRVEKRYVRKDTEIMWANMTATAVKDKAGRFLHFLIMVEDITERKRMEEALRESEERYRVIATNTPDHILMQDRDLRYIWVLNPQLGLTEESMIGKTDFDIFHREDAEKVTRIKKRVLTSGEPTRLEIALDSLKGPIEHFAGSYVPKYGPDGQVDGLIGYFRNVTEQKQTEVALRRERDFTDSIIETAQTIVLALDTQGRIVRFNSYMEEVSGYALADVQGKDWFSTFVPERNRERTRRLFLNAMGDIQTRGNVDQIVTKDGRHRDVEWHDKTLKDVQGNVVGLLCIGQDITDRRRAEEALRIHRQQLRVLASELVLAEERERRRIAADLHDNACQSLVLARMKLQPLLERAGKDSLLRTLDRALGDVLVNVRDLTFDLGSPTLYRFGLETALEELLEDQIKAKHGLECSFSSDGQAKPLTDDTRVLLFRSVRELLVNVIKHAKARKVALDIRRVGGFIEVTVVDDGAGCCVDEIFSSVERRHFGLFSIRERLDYIGGRLEVDSQLGQGSRFILLAPLDAKAIEAGRNDDAKQDSARGRSPGSTGGPATGLGETT